MAHKNTAEARKNRCKTANGELRNSGAESAAVDKLQGGQADYKPVESDQADDKSAARQLDEITGRFVGVDETDTAVNFSKIHVLKTRSSSEQNLMLKTSSLRKGIKYLSSTLLYNENDSATNQGDSDCLNNNNVAKDTLEINVTVSIDTGNTRLKFDNAEEQPEKITNNLEIEDDSESSKDQDCQELSDLIKAFNNAHLYKKNSNVYSVFQAKTVLSERRRSFPTIPKLITQKLAEHTLRTAPKNVENSDANPAPNKDFKAKTFKTLSRGLGKLLKRHSSVNISEPDPVFKVAYLGNVLTGWAKGDGCVDKPLATLWKNYNQLSKPDVVMKLSITSSGLKAVTKEHGLTEYWAHRITFCCSPPEYPKVFCWVYRHEGRKLKHELRCHAVLCTKDTISKKIATDLQFKIKQALFEFKRDKISRQNARLSLANSVYDNPSMPRRKILLSVGGNNYKPPLERSKSAPKLMAIEEMCSEEDEEETVVAEKATNTWTKDNSALKTCCKAEEIFPSHTLGRRRCDKRCSRKSILSSKTKSDIFPLQRLKSDESSECDDISKVSPKDSVSIEKRESDETDQEPSSHVSMGSATHVSFSFSNMSETSEQTVDSDYSNLHTDIDDDVFYCETEENRRSNEDHRDINENKSGLEQLCPKTNLIVLDSDEGSISSGCETASTVTSSDIEMTSLPCNFTQSEYKKDIEEIEKVSVLERVQSFEQLFNRERNHSTRNFRSFSKRNYGSGNVGNFRTVDRNRCDSDPNSSSPCESMSSFFPSIESGPASYGDEVNLVPLGEKQRSLDVRRNYMRCVTYPPSDDEANASSYDSQEFDHLETMGSDVCGGMEKSEVGFESDNKLEKEKSEGDSDSACSVESGYSELLDGLQNNCIIGNTVMV